MYRYSILVAINVSLMRHMLECMLLVDSIPLYRLKITMKDCKHHSEITAEILDLKISNLAITYRNDL